MPGASNVLSASRRLVGCVERTLCPPELDVGDHVRAHHVGQLGRTLDCDGRLRREEAALRERGAHLPGIHAFGVQRVRALGHHLLGRIGATIQAT